MAQDLLYRGGFWIEGRVNNYNDNDMEEISRMLHLDSGLGQNVPWTVGLNRPLGTTYTLQATRLSEEGRLVKGIYKGRSGDHISLNLSKGEIFNRSQCWDQRVVMGLSHCAEYQGPSSKTTPGLDVKRNKCSISAPMVVLSV
ncbi:hypothetical protein L3X38_019334 [Prunus dulcis]|uniref:Uncharacterized protein n=1 Tax=Prunus dulcis TaxID=3755 RepID=A0AAD4ZBL5_PRUDU|nr:hypothetical protein L3X38_019334 [Prunus dulcis]